MHCYRSLNHDARSKGKKFTSKVTTIQPPRIPWKTCNVIFLNSFIDIVDLSERLLFNANSAIFPAISWQEQIKFQ